jgi:hypothetical protein
VISSASSRSWTRGRADIRPCIGATTSLSPISEREARLPQRALSQPPPLPAGSSEVVAAPSESSKPATSLNERPQGELPGAYPRGGVDDCVAGARLRALPRLDRPHAEGYVGRLERSPFGRDDPARVRSASAASTHERRRSRRFGVEAGADATDNLIG